MAVPLYGAPGANSLSLDREKFRDAAAVVGDAEQLPLP